MALRSTMKALGDEVVHFPPPHLQVVVEMAISATVLALVLVHLPQLLKLRQTLTGDPIVLRGHLQWIGIAHHLVEAPVLLEAENRILLILKKPGLSVASSSLLQPLHPDWVLRQILLDRLDVVCSVVEGVMLLHVKVLRVHQKNHRIGEVDQKRSPRANGALDLQAHQLHQLRRWEGESSTCCHDLRTIL
jgi:hypothetical protein